uniref:NADH dehydrogenase [ubiquinone] 1 beta subcomplex subunit 4 n=1 Tax=Bos mutus grunniens TaxID=30521 RepID=A0A8B9WRV8_BOSMU
MHISPPSLSLPLPLPSRLSRSSWHTELTRLLFCWFSRLKKVIVAVLRQVVKMLFPKYKASRLASLPTTLDPAEYDISSETRKAQAKRLAIRSRLKREYQLHCRGVIEDPALVRWTYARSANIYPNFRPNTKISLLGALFGIGPLIFWCYVFKTDRDRKEKLIQEGKLDQTFNISY